MTVTIVCLQVTNLSNRIASLIHFLFSRQELTGAQRQLPLREALGLRGIPAEWRAQRAQSVPVRGIATGGPHQQPDLMDQGVRAAGYRSDREATVPVQKGSHLGQDRV